MYLKRNLLWVAIATNASLLPIANADDFGFEDEVTGPAFFNNYLELGIGIVSDDNGKFGEFSRDLSDEGVMGLGAIHLESESLNLDFTKTPYNTVGEAGFNLPGIFSIKIYGDENQKIEKYKTQTVYPDTGSASSLPIPAGLQATLQQGRRGPEWVPDYSDPSLYGTRTFKVERDTYGVKLTRHLGKLFSISADYNQQIKEGTKTQGNHENDAILPINVDYEHNQLDLGIEYHGEKLSLGASYYLSQFKDKNDFIAFESFEFTGDLLVPGIHTERIATEPNNTFSRLETDGHWRLGERTALNWMINWSKAEQDKNVISSSPSFDFNGEVNRFNGRITLTSRPTRNLNYKFEYAIKDREADHDPLDLNMFGYSSRDSSTFDKEQKTLKAEGGYRLPNRSKLRFGWRRDSIERDRFTTEDFGGEFAHTSDENDEDAFWIDYRFAPIGSLNLNVKLETADRDGNQEQHPEWIAPYYQDRDSDRLSINANLPVNNMIVLSGGLMKTQEDYDSGDWVALDGSNSRGAGGLISRDWNSTHLELTISPDVNLSFAIYGLWQDFEWKAFAEDQWGQYESDENVSVYGINLIWQAGKSIDIKADIAISDAQSELASLADSAPDTTTDTTRLDIEANWQYSSQTAFYGRLLVEEWDVFDWANEGTRYEDIAFGWNANDGKNYSLIVGVRRKF